MTKTPSVPALARGLSVLELLAGSNHGLTLPEIARRLALPKSSTYGLLATMERRGYLYRSSSSGRYIFGMKLLEVAKVSLSWNQLREQATSLLDTVVSRTGLTAHLGILEEDHAILVVRVSPPMQTGPATWIGKRINLHASAVGKILLAYLPEGDFERLVRNRRLSRFNDNTITSPAKLLRELDQIRRTGCAVEDEEEEIGYRCIAAPVRDASGNVVAAASICGTTEQITPENISPRTRNIKAVAELISVRLGACEPDWDETAPVSTPTEPSRARSHCPCA